MTKLIFLGQAPRLFEAPVTVNVPGEETPQHFTATFRDMPRKALQALMDGEDPDATVAAKVLANWDGIVDADKNAVEYSPENLERLLDRPYIAFAVADTYYQVMLGQVPGREAGNSSRLPAPGGGATRKK
ncbi:MAG: hypothetical protein OXS28_19275 [Gammaproteobacteria bacterium]|nr:hypothetical protein [Gammaproteobacteria bacterium]